MPPAIWEFLSQIETVLGIIGIGAIGVLSFFRRSIRDAFRAYSHNSYRHLADYVSDNLPPESELKKTVRADLKICIVDDQPEDFPIDHLRAIGFTIEVYDEISLSEAWKLTHYQIVFLDIVGVVTQDPDQGGLTIIRRLKESSSAPIVVAVSGQKFDASANEFFNRADHIMKKPVFEDDCERVLDELVTTHLLPYAAARRVDKVIDANVSAGAKWKGLNRKFIAFIEGDIKERKCRKQVTRKNSFEGWSEIVPDLHNIRSWINEK